MLGGIPRILIQQKYDLEIPPQENNSLRKGSCHKKIKSVASKGIYTWKYSTLKPILKG